LLTKAEWEQVDQAMEQLTEEWSGPYSTWLQHLGLGWRRLPELSPAVMKDLLLAWLSPAAKEGMVCRHCGLEYPYHETPPVSEWKLLPDRQPHVGPPPWYDLPVFFRDCPGCGGSSDEIDWPHLTEQHDRAWKNMDGYAGGPLR
jgi:hypothetical protein